MTVRMTGGAPASDEAIRDLERRVGFRVPERYRRFVAARNGAEFDPNIFACGNGDLARINRLKRIEDIDPSRIEFFPRQAFQVAVDDCGNYVYLRRGDDGVYFWDHEDPEAVFKLANDFDSFLSMLEPFDPTAPS